MAQTNSALASGGMHHCFFSHGFSLFFFNVLRTASAERLSTYSSSTIRSANSVNVQRARPSGGSLQANVTNRASFSPSIASMPTFLTLVQGANMPSSTNRCRTRSTVHRPILNASAIFLSFQAEPYSP